MNTLTEKIASSAIVALFGGFLIAISLTSNITYSFLIWMLTVVASGMAIGGSGYKSFLDVVNKVYLPAAVLAITPIMFFYFLAAIAYMQDPRALVVWPGSAPIDPFEPRLIFMLALVALFTFIGSALVVSLSVISSKYLLKAAVSLWQLGPEGLDKVRNIVIGVSAILGALITIIAVVTK